MIKRIPQNSILVELEKIADDQYKFSSGLTIFLNTTYNPEQHVRIYGTCVAIPDILTKGDLIKYEENDFRHIDSIVPEVRIGDTVYFSYVVINKTNLLEYEGRIYYNINYGNILCVVRENFEVGLDDAMNKNANGDLRFVDIMPSLFKKIIPIGGNILCEEYLGEGVELVEFDGRKIYAEVNKLGMITKVIKKPLENRAVVRITGAPLKGDDMEFKDGDVIVFPNKYGFKNNIEGKDYLFLKYWDVLVATKNTNN